VTLTEFVLNRIAEDEALARAGFSHPDRWVQVAAPGLVGGIPTGMSCPAVLAECAVKRRIIERRAYGGDGCGGHPGPYLPHADYGTHYCYRVDEDNYDLRDMASIYANHPDYRQEWKP